MTGFDTLSYGVNSNLCDNDCPMHKNDVHKRINDGQLGFVCFLKMCQPQHLFHLFSSLQTYIAIFTTNICEKCPSSIRCRDSNSQPLEQQSPPITTRPGLRLVRICIIGFDNSANCANALRSSFSYNCLIAQGTHQIRQRLTTYLVALS